MARTPNLGLALGRMAVVFNQLQSRIAANQTKTSFGFQVVLHTPNHDLSYKDRIALREMIIVRDYVEGIGDHIEVRVAIPMGTFLYRVYDFLENFEITLRVQKQSGDTSKLNAAAGIRTTTPIKSTTRYKAVYLVDKNGQIPNNRIMSEEDMNQRPPVVVTFQLIDRTVEVLRVKTIPGGTFSSVGGRINDFIGMLFSQEANNVLIEGLPCLDIVTTQPAPADSPNVGSLTLPSFSRLVEIPDYLQEKSVGVYNAGLGCYIQKVATSPTVYKRGMWLYSLYDPDREANNTVGATLYCTDESTKAADYPGITTINGMVTILGHGASGLEEDKEAAVMSEGSGFRIGNAADMLGPKAFKITKKGPVFERSKMTTEVVYKDRADGVQFAPQKGNYNNHLALASDVLKKQANYMTVMVSNLDHDLLFPGKLTKIIYYGTKSAVSSSGEVTPTNESIERRGILHKATIRYADISSNPIMDYTSTVVQLTSTAELKYCIGTTYPRRTT